MHTASPAAARAAWRIRGPVLLLLAAITVFGAHRLAFLCDDAFIAFRYVSNAHDGAGLVWNKAPFLPVEGYSCFLWAILLWVVWAFTGVEPPDAANPLSIAIGLVMLAVVARSAFRLVRRDGARVSDGFALVTVAVVVGNRTFLQWLSSGLETALYDCALVAWTLGAFRPAPERTTRWLAGWSTFAAIAALTRPDGLLVVAATGAAAAAGALSRERSWRATALGLAPLLTVVAHVLWRRSFYGAWLPNTYYAKVAAPWPEAGWRYLFCFVVEHGTWTIAPVAALWFAVVARRAALRALVANLPAVAAVATTIATVAYYTLAVGGDHFEYRVFSHLVPLSTLAVAAMALRCGRGEGIGFASVAALGIASTFGWWHLASVVAYPPPRYEAFAQHAPAWLRPFLRVYDRHQAWLQTQFVCLRCSQHATSLAGMRSGSPERHRSPPRPDDIPVLDVASAGYIAWALPDIAILDAHGLNDWVTARWPIRAKQALFPAAAAVGALQQADRDGDGRASRAEIADAFGVGTETAPERTWGVDLVLTMFARTSADALTSAEIAEFAAFCDGIRFMAHERSIPLDYRDAFAPNVTIEGAPGERHEVVHARATPLTPERVRTIEAEWRERVQKGMPR
ncbi:MAG: hypothetical protein JNK78_13810 [Planctomycetes bacterium]|nr:hypothetical protein [Planctomycetota bacterium]